MRRQVILRHALYMHLNCSSWSRRNFLVKETHLLPPPLSSFLIIGSCLWSISKIQILGFLEPSCKDLYVKFWKECRSLKFFHSYSLVNFLKVFNHNVGMWKYICICVCIYIYVHMSVHMYRCTHLRVRMCVCVLISWETFAFLLLSNSIRKEAKHWLP